MERQFELPEADREFLENSGFEWETVVDGATKWLLIHNRPILGGYSVAACTFALQIPPSYPESQIDMAYFHPPLQRADGKTIGALSEQVIRGTNFQRWSRHRTGNSQWRPDIDGISTHLTYVEGWLKEEFGKR
jgi:hypothetical protein